MVPNQLINYQPAPDSLEGKTILITGAAGGLGSTLAHAAAHLGADLVLLDNNEKKLNDLHDAIESEVHKQPGLYPLDFRGATPDDYETLAETINNVFNSLHGLIHCAATVGQVCPVETIDARLWSETFTTNLHAPIILTKTLLPLMRTSGNASIVFTSDKKTSAYWGAYGISKAAVVPAMQIIADELDTLIDEHQQFPVTCNAIDPGPMRTYMRSSAYPGEDPNTVIEPQAKVPAYLYLLSEHARDMNGELVTL